MPHLNTAMDTKRQPRQRPSGPAGNRLAGAFAFYALLIVFVAVAVILIAHLAGYRAARDEYAVYWAMETEAVLPAVTAGPGRALASAEIAAPSPAAALTVRPAANSRVSALRKENHEAVGWLDISGTDMQYPVVQSADNEYYFEPKQWTRGRKSSIIKIWRK